MLSFVARGLAVLKPWMFVMRMTGLLLVGVVGSTLPGCCCDPGGCGMDGDGPVVCTIAFANPLDGDVLNEADDADGDASNGIQIDPPVRVRYGAGCNETELTLTSSQGRTATAEVDPDDNQARFEGFTVDGSPQGTEVTLTIDDGAGQTETISITVVSVQPEPDCQITAPADMTTLMNDINVAADGFQARVEVACTSVAAGLDLAVDVEGTETVVPLDALLEASVEVTLPNEGATGNDIAIELRDDGGAVIEGTTDSATVFVSPAVLEPCDVTITDPADMATLDDAATDADGSTDGFQYGVVVSTGDATCAGETVQVTVNGVMATQTLGVNGGATVVMDFPNGTYDVSAVVLGTRAGAADTNNVTVTRTDVAPACDVTITSPTGPAVYDATATDANVAEPGFQVDLTVTTATTGDPCEGETVEATVDGSAMFSALLDANGEGTVQVTLPDGAYDVVAVVTGARAGASDTLSVTVDFTPPVIMITQPVEGQIYGPAADTDADPLNGITIDLTGSVTGATSADYALDCDSGAVTQSGMLTLDGSGVITAVPLADLPSSDCTLTVTASDGANTAMAVVGFTVAAVDVDVSFTGDMAPIGYWIESEDSVAGGPDMDIPVSVTVTFDENAGVTYTASAEVIRISDSSVVQTIDLGSLTSGVAATGTIVVPYGDSTQYRLEVTVTPSAGDPIGPATSTFYVDTVVPTLTWQSPGAGATLNASQDAEPQTPGFQGFLAVNTTSLPAASVVNLDYAGPSSLMNTCTVAANQLCFRNTSLADGAWTVTATATDAAGNAAVPSVRSFTVDATLPAVADIAVMADADSNGTVNRAENGGAIGGVTSNVVVTFNASAGLQDGRTVTLTVTPPGTNYNATVTGNQVTFTAVALAEGSLTLTVNATDAAGNPVATAGKTRAITVDTTPPTISIVAPAGGTITGSPVNITVSSNAGAGQMVTLSDISGTPVDLATAALVGSGVTFADVMLQQGNRTLQAAVSDPAGNAATTTRAYLVDTAAPVLTLALVATPPLMDADPSAPGFQVDFEVTHTGLETGQTIRLISALTGQRGSAPADGSGTTVVRATFVNSAMHDMTAQANDLAGNLGVSNVVTADIDTGLLDVFIDSPDVVGGVLSFGAGDVMAGTATLVLTVMGLSGAEVITLEIDGVPEPTASAVVAGDTVTVTWTVAEGETGELEVLIDDVIDGTSGLWSYEVDAVAPTVTWDPGTPTVFNVASDEAGAIAGLQTTVSVDVVECENGSLVVTEGGTTIGGPVAVPASGTATLAVEVDDQTEHDSATWTATCTDATGNAGDDDLVTEVDITPPATPSLTLTVLDRRRGQVRVEFTAPGDDGTAGDPATIQVVASRDPITDVGFDAVVALPQYPSTGGLVDESAVAMPGSAYTAQTEFLAFDTDWNIGVRATDDAGNTAVVSDSLEAQSGLFTETVEFVNTEDDVATGATADDRYGNVNITRGDLNNDGREDLVVTATHEGDFCTGALCNGTIRVYAGQDDLNTLSLSQTIASADARLLGTGPLIAESFNGDAFADLVVRGFDLTVNPGVPTPALFIYPGQAGATPLGTPAIVILPFQVARQRVLGDVNGDGFTDIGLARANNTDFHVVFGGSGIGAGGPVNLADIPYAILRRADAETGFVGLGAAAAGNLDGDTATGGGELDDFLLKGNGFVYVVHGRETWPTPPAVVDLGTVGASDRLTCAGANCGFEIVAGDVDGDGDMDAVFLNTASLRVHLNSGSGTFPTTASYTVELPRNALVAAAGTLALGDVNGDTAADVLVAVQTDGTDPSSFILYLGGGYTSGARTIFDAEYAEDFNTTRFGRVGVCGDLDNDGLDEICYGSELGAGKTVVRF